MKVCQVEGCNRKHYGKGLCTLHYDRVRRAADPEKRNLQSLRSYYRTQKPRLDRHPELRAVRRKTSATWYARHIEHASVQSHHSAIFHEQRSSYAGMPFHDDWNPDKGGSFAAGADWIIANIGKRPGKRWQLHIVDRPLGFAPDNLQWVPQDAHMREELVHKLLLENQNLRRENERLRAACS